MGVAYEHKIPVRDWGKSLTEPDQNYTVKELFQRFARGLPIQAAKQQPTFLGEENDVDIEKLSRMSRMDKLEQLDEIRLKAELLDTELADKEAQRSEAHKKAEEEAAAKAAAEAAAKAAKS